MRESPTLSRLLVASLALLSAFCSQIDISIIIPKYSSLTFYLAPIESIHGLPITLTVSYIATANGASSAISIFSSSFTLVGTSRYAIWNFEASNQTIKISLASSDGNLTENMLWVETIGSRPVFLAVFDKQTSSGHM